MTKKLWDLSSSDRWNLMKDAVTTAVEAEGYTMTRVPGRGRSNVWRLDRKGETKLASIRTTKDRWFAFPPLDGGKRWKTLDDVNVVFVAAADYRDEDTKIQVFEFAADEVRERFDAAYNARVKAGLTVQENFGMWIALDPDERGLPVSVGSGLAAKHTPIAVYSVSEILEAQELELDTGSYLGAPDELEELEEPPQKGGTIADIIKVAQKQIARVAGVKPDAVKLELKIEY